MTKKRLLVAGIFAAFVSALFFAQSTFAYTDVGTLTNMSMAQGIKACYEGGAFNDEITPQDFNSSTGVVRSRTVPVPISSSNTSGIINCQALINGLYGSLPDATDVTGITNYYKRLGYNKIRNGTDARVCFYYTLGQNKRTNSLCIFYDEDGNLDPNTTSFNNDGNGDEYQIYYQNSGAIYFVDVSQGYDSEVELFNINSVFTKTDLDAKVSGAASKIVGVGNVAGRTESTGTEVTDVYGFGRYNRTTAAQHFLEAQTDYNSFDETLYSQYDQHSYYKYYLMEYWGLSQDADNCSKTAGPNMVPFKTAPSDITYCGLKDASGTKVVGTNLDLSYPQVHSLDASLNGWGKVNNDNTLSISAAIAAINALDYNSSSMVAAGVNGLGPAPCVPGEPECSGPSGPSGGSGSGGGGGGGSSVDKCYEVAGVVGWIVCPAVEFMRTVMETAYNNMIEPMLQASPQLLTNSGTQTAWGTFRDFANVTFAIILLIVILSQATGYGIDNYGIKRMLPKLIVGAILINFSFLLCRIALDVSNITGSGLQNMLSSIGGGSSADFSSHISAMVGGLLTFAVGGTLVGAGVAITGGWAFLLPAILALISGIISFLFLFVILGFRQAGVVILAVASPLALVLYILPNTQSWAKRWAKMFGQLLLLYPIIGAVIGGCYGASKIIMSIDNSSFFVYLAGTLLTVVPYLAIPALLRSSMAALGNIGNTIGGLGQRLGRGAAGLTGNLVRQSGRFNASQNRSAAIRADRVRRAESRSAQNTIDRLNAIKARGGTLSARQERELARAQRTATSNIRADAADTRAAAEYERISSPAGQAALQAGLAAEAENAAIKDESAILDAGGYDYAGGHVDANDLSSLERALEYETSQDGEQNIARIMALKQTLEQKYAKKGMDAVARVMDSGNMKGEGARRIINSVASDGNYKNQARSVFAAANAIKGQAAFQSSGVVAGGQISTMRNTGGQIGNMKSENIGQMTDDEFDAFVRQTSNVDAGRMAQEALDDDTIRSQLNSDQINQLESLARATGQVSKQQRLSQEQNQVLNVQQQQLDAINQINQNMQNRQNGGSSQGGGQNGGNQGGGINPNDFPNGIGDEGYSTAPPPRDNE